MTSCKRSSAPIGAYAPRKTKHYTRTIREAEAKAAGIEARRRVIAAYADLPPIHIESLTFRDALCLVSMFRASGGFHDGALGPFNDIAWPISPTPELDQLILGRLYQARLVAISPDSEEWAVECDIPNEALLRYAPTGVRWILAPDALGRSPTQCIVDITAHLKSCLAVRVGIDELRSILEELAVHECLQGTRSFMQMRQMMVPAFGERWIEVARALLPHFSIGQAWYLAWMASRDAVDYFIRNNISRRHAANTVPGQLERLSERAQAGHWKLKPFRRNVNMPMSALTHTLIVGVLQRSEEEYVNELISELVSVQQGVAGES